MTHDLLELVKRMTGDDSLANARPKRLRFGLFILGARITRHARTWTVRLWEALPQAHVLVAIRRVIVELAALLRPHQAVPG